MRRFIVILSLAFTICLQSCGCNSSSENIKGVHVDRFVFIYDLDCIDLEKRPFIDTIINTPIPYPRDSSPVLLYYTDGDCSSCIAQLISFLKEYSYSIEASKVPLWIVLNSFSKELFSYYLNMEYDRINPSLKQENILAHVILSSDISAEKGLYLVVNRRIIRHADW